MRCSPIARCAGFFLLTSLLLLSVSCYSQCIVTVDARENITINTTQIAGNKTSTISANNLNVGFINQGNGAKLTLTFAGNNNTYRNDTIRFIGNMSVESI